MNKYFQEETRHSKGQQQTPDPVKTAASIPSKVQPRPDPEPRLYPRDQVYLVPVRGLANFQQVTSLLELQTNLREDFTITEKVKLGRQGKDHYRQAAL